MAQAYDGKWTMEFEQFKLTIYGMSTNKTLTPAEKPFTTRGDNDPDFFKAVRCGTGTIRVICKVGELDELANAKVTAHKVDLRLPNPSTGAMQLLWLGFVKQDIFTQEYKSGYVEMEIPVCDPLEAAGGVFTKSQLGNVSVGRIFRQFLIDMDIVNDVQSFMITSRTPVSCLQHKIQFRSLFWDRNEETPTECPASWGEILDEICKAYGWQMQFEEGNFCLFSRDCNGSSTYIVAASNLSQINPPYSQFTPTIYNAATQFLNKLDDTHHMSLYQGKSKVRVTGDCGETKKDLFRLDFSNLEPAFRGYIDESAMVYDFNYPKQSIRHLTLSGSALPSGQQPANFGLFQARYYQAWGGGYPVGEQPAANFYGANIGALSKRRAIQVQDVPSKEWLWVKGLFISPNTAGGVPYNVMTINTDVIDTTDAKHYVSIQGNVKRIISSDISKLFNNENIETEAGSLTAKIKFNGKWLSYNSANYAFSWVSSEASVPLNFNDEGSIVFPHPVDAPRENPELTYPDNCFFFLQSGASSALEITIMCDRSYFYILESMNVSVERASRTMNDVSKNEVVKTMNNGAHDDYSVDSKLTTARANQNGYGCILNSSNNPLSSLDDTGLSAEESLAQRIKAYYGNSYLMYEIGATTYVPVYSKIRMNGNVYACISNDYDWRTGKNKVTFIQIK